MKKNTFFQIAIDGPVAAGKGTIAKKLAARLKFLYVDTGAMYRTAALLCKQEKMEIEPKNETLIVQKIKTADFHLQNSIDEKKQLFTLVTLNGQDVSDSIRTQAVSAATSKIATLAQVRKVMVEKQQGLAEKFNVVMEGRDIGLRVLPTAQIKIYLTADLEERTARRAAQLQAIGEKVMMKEIKKQIEERDAIDMNREVDPLVILPEAIVIDTTKITINQAVTQIAQLAENHPDYQA